MSKERLSQIQKDILLKISELQNTYSYPCVHGASVRAIRKEVVSKHPSRSESASFSRSVSRLEQRGLIETNNTVSDANQKTCVRLTDRGEQIIRDFVNADFKKH